MRTGTTLNYLKNECFMYKFDIKQRYHHLDIKLEHQKYLGFAWEINGKVRCFVFTVLPASLTSVPFLFTNTMRVLVKHWSENKNKICCFLDEEGEMEVPFYKTFASSQFLRNFLIQSGFAVNQEKSGWYPTTNMIWLGINLDFDNKIFSILYKRIFSIPTTITNKYSCILCNIRNYSPEVILILPRVNNFNIKQKRLGIFALLYVTSTKQDLGK